MNPDISTVELAQKYASENFGSQFKQKCVHCNAEKSVTGKIFAERIEKVYAMGEDLRTLLKNYHCKKCRKELGVTLIGTPKPPKKTSAAKTITDIDE